MAPGQTLLVDRPRTGITVATLNRPDQLNALTFGMFDAADACAPVRPSDGRSAQPHRKLECVYRKSTGRRPR
jgi:hypothetical protein